MSPGTGPVTGPTVLPHVEETAAATARYLEALTVLDAPALARPSLLPGWSRAHVVAHLSRNADAVGNLLRWATTGEPTPMYASQEQRDADIATTAALPREELLADARESADRLAAAFAAFATSGADPETPVGRTPGSATFPVRRTGAMRRTEVEVHHADLGAGYTAADWPADLHTHLLHRLEREVASDGRGLTVRATDTGEGWTTGEGPTVEGTAAALVWWMIGRGRGEGLVCSTGDLPELGKWA